MQATSAYLNRPKRSQETVLLTRITRAALAGQSDVLAELELANLDSRNRRIKPRRSETPLAGE